MKKTRYFALHFYMQKNALCVTFSDTKILTLCVTFLYAKRNALCVTFISKIYPIVLIPYHKRTYDQINQIEI